MRNGGHVTRYTVMVVALPIKGAYQGTSQIRVKGLSKEWESKLGSDHHFGSFDEAFAFCRNLLSTGAADVFRGQSRDWPTISPSLFRGDVAQRGAAATVLDEFIEWGNAVPQMAPYWKDIQQLTAIAQHYGIPTSYLDLTTDPEIAALFATESAGVDLGGEAVIYCFKAEELTKLPGFELHEIDVINLWRLKAQKGLFLEYQDQATLSAVRDCAIRVYFPVRHISSSELAVIYPPRKSALEIVIDQWMYRHKITQIFKIFSDSQAQLLIKRYSYPGFFRWREIPEFDPHWVQWNAEWIAQVDDTIIRSQETEKAELRLPAGLSVREAYDHLEGQVRGAISSLERDRSHIEFGINIETHEAESSMATIIINWCWDGLRVHPYSEDSLVRCLASAALAIFRRIEVPDEKWEQHLWGETESIDTAPVGGHLDSGEVSKESLMAALHTTYHGNLTSFARRKAEDDPLFIMNYVVDPWILFDFDKFSKMFVEEFIPSCIGWFWKTCLEDNEGELSDLWAISFNPALLGFVTLCSYRFHSPIAIEAEVEKIVLVSTEMTESDIEESFISCLPTILGGEEPFTVKFTDYSRDPREIWEIEEAVEQCRMIVRTGGISVLDVIPNMRDMDAPERDAPAPWKAKGMGALDIWAIANGRLSEINGIPFGEIRHVIEEFYSDLMHSNQELELRAKRKADWPEGSNS